MKKRYFFISYVLVDNALLGTKTKYGNSISDTDNGRYIQLQNTSEAILSAHAAVEDLTGAAYVKILNIVELSKEDWEELSK